MPRLRLALSALSTRRLLALALTPALTIGLVGLSPLALAVALTQGALIWLLLSWLHPATREAMPAGRGAIDAMLAQVPRSDRPESLQTAALVLRLDGADPMPLDRRAAVLAALSVRLGGALREGDGFCRLDPDGFGVALTPQRRLSTDAVLAVAGRL